MALSVDFVAEGDSSHMLVYAAALVLYLRLEMIYHRFECPRGAKFFGFVCDHVIQINWIYSAPGGPIKHSQVCDFESAKDSSCTEFLGMF